jgi:putative membrane protein
MTLRWLMAAAHILPLGIGLLAVWMRGRVLRDTLDLAGLRRAFVFDNFWGAAAAIWLITGLWRAFGGLEKGTAYYLGSTAFWVKMGLLGLILVLEIWPMVTLIRWRLQLGRGLRVDTGPAGAIATISAVQTLLIVLMVLAATAMARGLGG